MNKFYVYIYVIILPSNLVVVMVEFIHDELEIEVHCTAMVVKSLLYRHRNYYLTLFERPVPVFLFSFNSSLLTIKLQ